MTWRWTCSPAGWLRGRPPRAHRPRIRAPGIPAPAQERIVTRDMIALEVWKEPTGSDDKIIDVYINSLRKKVERPGWARLIHTVAESAMF